MEENGKKENKVAEFVKKHPKAVFWLRFFLFTICALVLPILFVGYRFELFHKASKISISGAGVIVIVIVAVFVATIIKYVKNVIKVKNVFISQCISGVCKIIIPLLAALALIENIKDNLDIFLQSLGMVIICEAFAIPLNPLPTWAAEQQKDIKVEERKDTVDYLLDGFFKRKNGGE